METSGVMRKFRSVSIPQHAHPLVRQLFAEMNHQRIGIMDMAERSGIAHGTFKGWRTKHCPRVAELEACFNVLGMRLTTRRCD